MQRIQESKNTFEKEPVEGLKLPDFNNYYKVTEGKTDVGIKMGKYINQPEQRV